MRAVVAFFKAPWCDMFGSAVGDPPEGLERSGAPFVAKAYVSWILETYIKDMFFYSSVFRTLMF